MQAKKMNLKPGDEKLEGTAAPIAELGTLDKNVAADGWIADEQLNDSCVSRNPLEQSEIRKNLAAHALASGRRTVRLLWIALVVSLTAHLVIPVCLVTAMVRPEKVALMDGTESLIISSLVPLEESKEILETLSLWAAKSFLDRGPQGFEALNPVKSATRLDREAIDTQKGLQSEHFFRTRALLFVTVLYGK